MEDGHIEEVQLDLEVEEPPTPEPEPEGVTETDPATEAFARLEGEMAMVRHTVQNMARERADRSHCPDLCGPAGTGRCCRTACRARRA